MKTGALIDELLAFGDENEIRNIRRMRPLLLALKEDLGHKDPRKLSPLEIHEFFKNNVANYEEFLAASDKQWDERYDGRYMTGVEKKLPWELTKPEKELRDFVKGKSLKGLSVLELGCGDGLHSVFLARKGAKVTAVDLSRTAIRVAKAHAREAGVSCSFHATDLFELDLGDAKFDLIFDKHCFHHVPVPRYHEYRCFVHRHLSDRGTFFLIAHTHNRFLERAQDLYLGLFSRVLKLVCDNTSVSGFTKTEIQTIFSDYFRITEMKITHDDDRSRDLQFVSARMTKKPLKKRG